ncbi:MAG: hypothetical protein IJ035_10210 [Oscillospiraceae bacterium]|nr:hypothetical protein [Oscillospiraceae bacterium]
MGNYRNFELVVYFVAHGVKNVNEAELNNQIDFFKKYMRIDKVYLEPFRDGCFASEEQLRLCRDIFAKHGIRSQGGITTSMPDPEGAHPKQRLFNVMCYNDEVMMNTLKQVCEMNARVFDGFIIDDFFFTNCTCEKCRKGRDEFNAEHGITDGSWQAYRTHLMYEASKKYVIEPAKTVNPDCKITIKYPNWMESYQETGYDPASQKEIFDYIYTGTETRDPINTDQHLPRYLSYSLMKYMDKMAPGRNGGGWFDPFDCRMLDYYLEQAYLTAFAKPKEVMMFCFQALADSVNVPALGFMLDKLDSLLDGLGEPIGVPCYIPNASQGEDNVQDFLGMNGFPVLTTPDFEADVPAMLLTASSAYDKDIIGKLEKYVADGGKAIVTSGFIKATLGNGIKRITSIRDRNRKMTVKDYAAEMSFHFNRWERESAAKAVTVPVMEFRNNATWGAICKGISEEEACTLFAIDTYGDGQMYTLVVPETFADIKHYPETVLNRMRKEFAVNGIRIEGKGQISIFAYDNDTFVIYPYVDNNTYDSDITVHIKDAKAVAKLSDGKEILPLYMENDEAVFRLRAEVGKFVGYKIIR